MAEPHRIGGRYEVGELLGRGGMAEVRKGTDVRLGRTVAIKRLRTDLASDATFQARFRREAQSAASLNHPAIVSVYDTGEEMSTDGSNVAQPYIVMEYVAGRTLRDIIREGRKILPERALEITSGVLAALDYSHRAGIIHRDIKPGNVMLTPSGRREGDGLRHRPRRLRRVEHDDPDRGGRRAPRSTSPPSRHAARPSTPAPTSTPPAACSTSCSPDGHRSSATARSRWPTSTCASRPRRRRRLDEDLTPELDAIVMKSLAKNVGDRYASAAAMKADIDRYLAGQAGAGARCGRRPQPPVPRRDNPTQVTEHGGARGRRGARSASGVDRSSCCCSCCSP